MFISALRASRRGALAAAAATVVLLLLTADAQAVQRVPAAYGPPPGICNMRDDFTLTVATRRVFLSGNASCSTVMTSVHVNVDLWNAVDGTLHLRDSAGCDVFSPCTPGRSITAADEGYVPPGTYDANVRIDLKLAEPAGIPVDPFLAFDPQCHPNDFPITSLTCQFITPIVMP